jgi:hypothetical protein
MPVTSGFCPAPTEGQEPIIPIGVKSGIKISDYNNSIIS